MHERRLLVEGKPEALRKIQELGRSMASHVYFGKTYG